ncbi:MAG TPA: HdeA/HdeB family chaperone [Methylovirgula sp.]
MPFLLASLLAPCASMPAAADDIDLSRIRCGDFVGGSKDDAILLLTWIEGYFAKKSDPPIIYGDKAKQHAEAIRDYCINYENATLFDAAKAVMK